MVSCELWGYTNRLLWQERNHFVPSRRSAFITVLARLSRASHGAGHFVFLKRSYHKEVANRAVLAHVFVLTHSWLPSSPVLPCTAITFAHIGGLLGDGCSLRKLEKWLDPSIYAARTPMAAGISCGGNNRSMR